MASMAPEIRAEVARLVEGLVDGYPAFMAALSPVRGRAGAQALPGQRRREGRNVAGQRGGVAAAPVGL